MCTKPQSKRSLAWLLLAALPLIGCAPEPLPLAEGGRDELEAGLASSGEGGSMGASTQSISTEGLRGDELKGLWRATLTTTTTMTLPVLMDEITTTLHTELSLDVRQVDDRLWVSARTCLVESLSEPDIGQRVIPTAFIEALGPVERQGRVWREGSQLSFELERSYELRGVMLDDPIADALPASADDPRVVDLDRDGHPGLTVTLTGFPSGDVYLVQRAWDEWLGGAQLVDGAPVERLTGVLEWGDEQSRLAATNEALLIDVPQQIPRGEGLQVFEMYRVLPEAAGCD